MIQEQEGADNSPRLSGRLHGRLTRAPASVTLVIRALVVSARWAGRARRLALERATAAGDANREAALEARVMVLEDMVEQRDAHIEVLESRLGEKHSRKPYPLMERLRIIWRAPRTTRRRT